MTVKEEAECNCNKMKSTPESCRASVFVTGIGQGSGKEPGNDGIALCSRHATPTGNEDGTASTDLIRAIGDSVEGQQVLNLQTRAVAGGSLLRGA